MPAGTVQPHRSNDEIRSEEFRTDLWLDPTQKTGSRDWRGEGLVVAASVVETVSGIWKEARRVVVGYY
jgi:hypothetical protein